MWHCRNRECTALDKSIDNTPCTSKVVWASSNLVIVEGGGRNGGGCRKEKCRVERRKWDGEEGPVIVWLVVGGKLYPYLYRIILQETFSSQVVQVCTEKA